MVFGKSNNYKSIPSANLSRNSGMGTKGTSSRTIVNVPSEGSDTYIGLVLVIFIPILAIFTLINIYLFGYRLVEASKVIWEFIWDKIKIYAGKVGSFFSYVAGKIVGAAEYVWGKIGDFFNFVVAKGKIVVDEAKIAISAAKDITKIVINKIEDVAKDVYEYIRQKFNEFIDSTIVIFNFAKNAVISIAKTVFGYFKSFIDAVSGIAENVFDFFSSLFDDFLNLINGIVDFFGSAVDYLLNLPSKLIDGISNTISSIVPGL